MLKKVATAVGLYVFLKSQKVAHAKGLNFYQGNPRKNQKLSERKIDSILVDCDALFDLGEIDDLVEKLRQLSQKWPTSVELAWRLSRALLIKSSKEKDQTQRKILLNDAFETASFGMRLNQNCWQTHHCYAVALWDLKTTQSLSSLIEAAPIVKYHLERSLEINPYPTTYHHLGAWHYRFARFPPYQRKLCSLLFDSFPESTFEIALDYFQKAEKLDPGFNMKNRLMIAKCYQHLGEREEALKNFQIIKDCNSIDLDLTIYKEACIRLNSL